jgi:hypothetical protein
MRDFNPGSGVRPKVLEFVGLTNGGSLVPFTPRSLFTNAQKTATAALAGSLAEGALAAPALNTAAASSRATGQKSRTTTKAPGGRTCSIASCCPGPANAGRSTEAATGSVLEAASL